MTHAIKLSGRRKEVLALLYNAPMTAADMSICLEASCRSINGTVRDLLQMGLVRKQIVQTKTWQQHVAVITASGRKALSEGLINTNVYRKPRKHTKRAADVRTGTNPFDWRNFAGVFA